MNAFCPEPLRPAHFPVCRRRFATLSFARASTPRSSFRRELSYSRMRTQPVHGRFWRAASAVPSAQLRVVRCPPAACSRWRSVPASTDGVRRGLTRLRRAALTLARHLGLAPHQGARFVGPDSACCPRARSAFRFFATTSRCVAGRRRSMPTAASVAPRSGPPTRRIARPPRGRSAASLASFTAIVHRTLAGGGPGRL